ncbi:hypothetical protein Clacol_006379 [Clathrus columnatus]|uniref:Uncharacterized protein n=1 Tax=Clathrus columnatus TaxID=1419009 RepID=A0AAV5AF49_9AGAM|nr:hypothetical protein Clacol_006379 [Clathrus columnatus]
MTPTRYIVLALGIIISLHFILTFSHEGYGQSTSLFRWTESSPKPFAQISDNYDTNTSQPIRKAKATFVILARNGDLNGVLSSMKQMEDRFNNKFHYPYVFLNEQPFTEEFKKLTSEITTAPVFYGLIPKDDWYQPNWIDEEKATNARKKMEAESVIYGVFHIVTCVVSTPGYVRQRFTVSLLEYQATIPTLWETTKSIFLQVYISVKALTLKVEFMEEHPEHVHKNNAMGFLSPDGGSGFISSLLSSLEQFRDRQS